MATVDIWRWRIEPDVRLAGYLSEDERARAACFARPDHAASYTATRGRLRAILGAVTGAAPSDIRFDYGPHGKPSLSHGPPFNLSHSGGVAILAITDGPEVGVDVEAWCPVEPSVADRYFTPAEREALAAMPFDLGFFRCWSRKEAVVKAIGMGLSMPLHAFDVTLGGAARIARIDGDDPSAWHLIDLHEPPGASAALALRDPEAPPRIRRHDL